MKRVAVRFAYLGDGFSGSQIQPEVRTVEGEMRAALHKVCGLDDDRLDLRIASRTDRGVNALGNVAVFNTGIEDPDTLLRALNAVSDGIFYTAYAEVDGDFNPRHASARSYRYVIPSEGLNIDLARECAKLFIGEHDFVRFCRPDGFFLWNMVRRTAAAIISVASGRSSLDEVRSALEGEDINFGVARADALTLTSVEYEGLDFTPSSSSVLSERVDECAFSADLRRGFYTALQD